jgi:hypothetical protein
MLSSVLRGQRAVLVNIEVMRGFVRLRRILASHAELHRRLGALEKKYNANFKVVFDAIRELMEPAEKPKKRTECADSLWPRAHRCAGCGISEGRASSRHL